MEKLFLHLFAASQKMNVVHQENVTTAVFFTEWHKLLVLDGIDILVDEAFGGNIGNPARLVLRQEIVADRMHEMGFSKPRCPINKKRIVSATGRMRDSPTTRMSILIARPDDKAFKGK